MPLGPISGKSPQAFFRILLSGAKKPPQSAAERRCGANGRLSRPDLERRILGVSRGTGARSSALPHTPTCRELYCRRIVGPVMVRIDLDAERGAGGLVFPIAFLSLMDGLETIH